MNTHGKVQTSQQLWR